MTIFFKFWPEKIKKTKIKKALITLQALRLNLKCLFQLHIFEIDNTVTKSISPNSAIFIENKKAENLLSGKI